jgi:hypothetical protein
LPGGKEPLVLRGQPPMCLIACHGKTIQSRKKGDRFSLTPGFSLVMGCRKTERPFQRFFCADKPLKRLAGRDVFCTRLKPGVNEMSEMGTHFLRVKIVSNQPTTHCVTGTALISI